jgi:hypothetical protein
MLDLAVVDVVAVIDVVAVVIMGDVVNVAVTMTFPALHACPHDVSPNWREVERDSFPKNN